ncbi:MAG: TIGR02466 family protein [Sphingomicrobium sp.]
MFMTPLLEAEPGNAVSLAQLAYSIRTFAAEDQAGRRWAREHRYPGYTSYASLNDLTTRDPAFADFAKLITRDAAKFARALGWDVRPKLDSLWVNLLKGSGQHSGHIHPHSILSGTFYVEVPIGSGAIRFEDPRLGLMMAAPLRRGDADETLQPFVTVAPRSGQLLMWESWLRHEVLAGSGKGERLSVSFNFR